MNHEQVNEILKKIDSSALAMLSNLRMCKKVDEKKFESILDNIDSLTKWWSDEEFVPKKAVGNLWFIFTTMLTEAEHASDPEPILDSAWELQEKLRKTFGPIF